MKKSIYFSSSRFGDHVVIDLDAAAPKVNAYYETLSGADAAYPRMKDDGFKTVTHTGRDKATNLSGMEANKPAAQIISTIKEAINNLNQSADYTNK